MKLRHVASVRNSNVDKVSNPDETVVRLCNYVDVYKNDFITNDLPFMLGTATQKEIDAFRLRVGDVIITKDSEDRMDIGIPALVRSTAEDLVCGYHLTMLRPKNERILGSYLFWALQTHVVQHAFANAAFGVTRYGLSMGAMKSIDIPTPDLSTQQQIAGFLDRETGRIDALIEKKERMVSLLGEKREKIITNLILGDEAEFNNESNKHSPDLVQFSRVHTLRTRNQNFFTTPLRYLCSIVTRGKGQTSDITDEGDVIYLTAEDMNDIIATGERKTIHPPDGRPDDIVACLIGSTTGKVSLAKNSFRTNPQIAVLRARKNVCPTWLVFALKSAKRDIIANANMSGVMPFINASTFMGTLIPTPSYSMQKQISASLMEKTAKIDRTIALTRTSIERLKEYRATLITAAVTGQIDLTTYKAGQMTGDTNNANGNHDDDITDQAATNTA